MVLLPKGNVFYRHVYMLRFMGITIPSVSTSTTQSCWANRLNFALIQLMLSINGVCQFRTIFQAQYTLPTRAISLALFLISLMTQVKLLLVQLNSSLLAVLFEELNTPDAMNLSTDMLQAINRISRAYIMILSSLLAAWLAYPWLTGNLNLPIPYWLPFEVDNFYKYVLTYGYLSTVLAIVCCTQDAVDTLLLLISGQICRRLYAIRVAVITLGEEEPLMKTKWIREKTPIDSLGLNIVKTAWLSKDETLLKEFIREHGDIIRLIRILDTVLDDIFLAQVLQSTIVSTIYFFAASKSDDILRDFPKFLIVLLATYIQFYMYCWLGEEISQQNDEIHRTLYLSEWYKCTERIMKALVIIQTFTKTHFKLEGGHLFRIDLRTFLLVLQESFSYFMVLRAVMN